MPAFEPAAWTYRATPMPIRAASDAPTGYWVTFGDHLYVVTQGYYQNVGGYPYANMNVQVGSIARTENGVAWTTVWDGALGAFGRPQWQPGAIFVIGDALYCFIFALAWAYVDPWAILGPGEVALMRSTNGTTWTKVQTFHSWTEKNHGSGSAFSKGASAQGAAWHARRSSAGGDDWLIVGWAVRCDGSTGTFYEDGTKRYRSADGGLTWTFVADMKGVYPFTTAAGSIDAPGSVQAIWRSPTLGDRWFMFGGSGTMNWSDDEGTTWTQTVWDTLPVPGWMYPLTSGGLLVLGHGSTASVPTVKVSCNLGVSLTTTPAPYVGRVGTQVAALQFGAVGALGEGGEEGLAMMRTPEAFGPLGTGIWVTDNGGETWTYLGKLATWYTVAFYLARTPTGRVVFYTAAWASAGGPQVWTCDDAPAGVLGDRTICLDLTPIEEEEPPVVVTPPEPVYAMATWSLQVVGTYKP